MEAAVGALLDLLEEAKIDSSSPPIVSVQPVSLSPIATRLCVEACYKYGWRLSLQMHRYIELE